MYLGLLRLLIIFLYLLLYFWHNFIIKSISDSKSMSWFFAWFVLGRCWCGVCSRVSWGFLPAAWKAQTELPESGTEGRVGKGAAARPWDAPGRLLILQPPALKDSCSAFGEDKKQTKKPSRCSLCNTKYRRTTEKYKEISTNWGRIEWRQMTLMVSLHFRGAGGVSPG